MISAVLLIVALICFILATCNYPAKLNLTAMGLAFMVLASLVTLVSVIIK